MAFANGPEHFIEYVADRYFKCPVFSWRGLRLYRNDRFVHVLV